MTKRSPFRYFNTSPEIIHLAVMMYVRFPLSLRNGEGGICAEPPSCDRRTRLDRVSRRRKAEEMSDLCWLMPRWIRTREKHSTRPRSRLMNQRKRRWPVSSWFPACRLKLSLKRTNARRFPIWFSLCRSTSRGRSGKNETIGLFSFCKIPICKMKGLITI